jgi:uroporphyrinogen-III synthase
MIAFVGAGAVDLGLLPTRATKLLAQAERVVVEPALQAELVARELAHDAAVIEVAQVGQGSFGPPASERVVRLVRGEVMRRAVGEVRAARRAGHEVEVLPAVSDEGAAAAFGGVELGPSARGGQRLVHPGTARQRVGEASEEDAGDAVWLPGAPDPELRWFDTRPLFGKRVLVTRARQQAADFCLLLESRGAEPVVAPAIEIHPPDDPAPLAASVRDLAGGSYDVVAFTSANGVDAFGAELARQGRDARVFGGARIAVIGPGTGKALGRLGLRADIVAPEHVGESLADAIIADRADAGPSATRRVLLPRARVARDVAPERLRAAGFTVDVVPAYETRSPAAADFAEVASALSEGQIDAVTFTSTSTVTHLLAALGADAASRLERTVVASIGPITSAACQAAGVRVDVTAGVYTIPGLTGSLERHFVAVDKREARRRS